MRKKILPLCSRFGPAALFVGLVVFGLGIVTDFGLYIDEFTNHYFGVTWYKYAHGVVVDHAPLGQLPAITRHDIVHGPVVEMTLAWIESAVLHLTVIRTIVFFRHGAVWVIFCVGVMSFYFLSLRLFARRWLALLACLFLVLQPRIFSHAFYDSVDIPFLALYACSLHTLVRYAEKRTIGSLCLHALMCALLIDIRLIGAAIPGITCIVLLAEILVPEKPAEPLPRRWGKVGIYGLLVAGLTVACWPYLWANPLAGALEVLRQTPKVGWGGIVLYLGQIIRADTVPWHYIPVWILITTPIAYSVLFLIGLADWFVAALRKPVKFYREHTGELVVLAAFFGPLLAVILMKAELYDAWRHMFFLYPAFVLIAVGGLSAVVRGTGAVNRTAKGAVAVLIAANLLTVGWFMIKNHPYENVYFNRLAGPDMKVIKQRFELDYWGLSYRRALEYVMAHDPARPVKIYHSDNALLAINYKILPLAEQGRVEDVAKYDESKYIFTNYRQVREGYPALERYYSIDVEGVSIMGVYRKEPAAKPAPKN